MLFININKANEKENFFIDTMFDSLKFILVIEFILNFYAYSFLVEMILMPVLLFLSAISSVPEFKKYLLLVKVVNYILAFFGLAQIVYIIYKIANNFQGIFNTQSLLALILPILLTFAYLPFIYFFALYIKYETIFRLLKHALKLDKKLIGFAKKKVLIVCNISLKKLNSFHRRCIYKFFDVKNSHEISDIISKFEKDWKYGIDPEDDE